MDQATLPSQTFQLDPSKLFHVLKLLEKSLYGADNATHRQVQQEVDSNCSSPAFSLYLSAIFSATSHVELLQAFTAVSTGGQVDLSSLQYDGNTWNSLRYMAGLVLRKAIERGLRDKLFEQAHLQYLKNSVVRTVRDENDNLRKAGANLTATIARTQGIGNWPELVSSCAEVLSNLVSDPNAASTVSSAVLFEGILRVLENLIEDCIEELSKPVATGSPIASMLGSQPPLAFFIPRFIQLLSFSSSSKDVQDQFRLKGLVCLNAILANVTFFPSVASCFHAEKSFSASYLTALSALTQSTSPRIKRQVCVGLGYLVNTNFATIAPHLTDISNFMLSILQTKSEEFEGNRVDLVKLEACEFFCSLADLDSPDKQLNTISMETLKRLVEAPQEEQNLVCLLLISMTYSEDELIMMGTEQENSQEQPDRIEDIKPKFHSNSSDRYKSKTKGAADDQDDEVITENIEIQDYMAMWTLRKAAAETLDRLSSLFPDQVFSRLMPLFSRYLDPNSSSQPVAGGDTEDQQVFFWKMKEASVLALGAIAQGCGVQLRTFLPKLLPYLLSLTSASREGAQLAVGGFLADYDFLLRFVSCWTLSRFTGFLQSESQGELRLSVISSLVRALRDPNKKVQSAACSALAECEEALATRLTLSNVLLISNELAITFQLYMSKGLVNNVYSLLDVITSLFGNYSFPEPSQTLTAADTEVVDVLMTPLFERFNQLNEEDQLIFVLINCISAICKSAKTRFRNFALRVYQKAVSIIENTIIMLKAARDNQFPEEEVTREAMISAIDLFCSLSIAFKGDFVALVNSSCSDPNTTIRTNIWDLLNLLLEDDEPDVLQVLFGLIGDLAQHTPTIFRNEQDREAQALSMQLLHKFVDKMVNAIYPVQVERIEVTSNAIWGLGELIVAFPRELQGFNVLKDLVTLGTVMIQDESLDGGLLENIAIALGRAGLVEPALLAESLPEIVYGFLASLIYSPAEKEKVEATKGFLSAALLNPKAVSRQSFTHLWYFIVNFPLDTEQAQTFFKERLRELKASLVGINEWEKSVQCLTPENRSQLQVFLS